MLIGYARVSTPEQALSLQEDALKQAGCKKIYSEIASGAKTERIQCQTASKVDPLSAVQMTLPTPSLRRLISG